MSTPMIPPQRGLRRYIYLEDLASPGAQILSDTSTGSLTAPIDFGFKTNSGAGDDQWLRIEGATVIGFRTNNTCPPDTFFGLDELPNGLLIQVLDDQDNINQHFGTDTNPIKRHHDFGILAGVDVDRDVQGAKTVVSVRWGLSGLQEPSTLHPGWTFRIRVRDDLSGIDKLTVMLQGLETPVT